MPKRQQSSNEVPRLTLSRKEFDAALERASNNVRSWPSLRDPNAPPPTYYKENLKRAK